MALNRRELLAKVMGKNNQLLLMTLKKEEERIGEQKFGLSKNKLSRTLYKIIVSVKFNYASESSYSYRPINNALAVDFAFI